MRSDILPHRLKEKASKEKGKSEEKSKGKSDEAKKQQRKVVDSAETEADAGL